MQPLSVSPRSRLRRGAASVLLFAAVAAVGLGLSAWKSAAREAQAAAAAAAPEPMEVVAAVLAAPRSHVATTTAIGTVLALRSITLENEVPGTVHEVYLPVGEIVEAGTVLVALDVSVEEAELRAQEAHAALTETLLGRVQRASDSRGASAADVDRARAERDVALANVARTRAVIDRKTIRAPFRARVGLADVHPGQYLPQGTRLTTLQGVDEAVHVDFTVAQDAARVLVVGAAVEVVQGRGEAPIPAHIVAVDSRVDPATRNAIVRARIEGVERMPAPGSSVRVRVPLSAPREAVTVPADALRRGPGGDHVFVIAEDAAGDLRAHERRVESGPALGEEIVIETGLEVGERVASAGSFKLREGALVAVADDATAKVQR